MSVVIFRFLRSKGFLGFGITKATFSEYEHVEFGTKEGTWIGAHFNGGIQERPANYCDSDLLLDDRYELEATDAQYDIVIGGARALIGTKYDILDIPGLLFHDRRLHDPHAYICSRVVFKCSWPVWQLLNVYSDYDYLVTPETLHLSPLFIGKRKYHWRKGEPAADKVIRI